MTKRVGIIATSAENEDKPSWSDAELQEFQRSFLNSPGGTLGDPEQGATDLKVSQIETPTNKIKVAPGVAFIEITKNEKTFKVRFENFYDHELTVESNSTGVPRVDRIVARVDVETDPDSAADNIAILEIVPGAPAASPLPADEPANAMTLALLDVANGQVEFTDSDLTDHRVQVTLKKEFLRLIKDDVGLENVGNFGVATQQEAEAGQAEDKYMTPKSTSQAISVLASGGRTAFVAAEDLEKHSVCRFVEEDGVSKASKLERIVDYDDRTISSEEYFWEAAVLATTNEKNIDIITLDDKKRRFVLIFASAVAPHYRVKIGTIAEDNTVSFGDDVEIPLLTADSFLNIKATALSSEKFVVASNQDGGCVVGEVSGDTVTFGTAVEFATENPEGFIDITRIRDDKFAVAYFFDRYTRVSVGVVSGTSMSFSDEVKSDVDTEQPSLSIFSENTLFLSTTKAGSTVALSRNYFNAYDISSDTNAPVELYSKDQGSRSFGILTPLSENKILVQQTFHEYLTYNFQLHFQVVNWDESNSDFTFGPRLEFQLPEEIPQKNEQSTTALNQNEIALVYNISNESMRKILRLKIDEDDNITATDEEDIYSQNMTSPVIQSINDELAILAFNDTDGIGEGIFKVVSFNVTGVEHSHAVAVANNEILRGEEGDFTFLGSQMTGQEGLVTGQKKYVSDRSLLSDDTKNCQMATVIDSNTMLVHKMDIS